MLELQQLDSFNSGLFLVYWYIFTAWKGLEPKGYDSFKMAGLTLRREEKIEKKMK